MTNNNKYTEYRVNGKLYGWFTPCGKLTNTNPNKSK